TTKDNKYYCNLCAAGGWNKSVSLSQHMRHIHKSEYNASIEVPLTKRRWTRDEMLILPELEANIPSSDGTFINQVLAKKFPSRTLESIKSRCKTTEYRILLQQIRDCQAAQIIEGSYCTVTLSSDVNSTTVVNNSINLTEDNDNSNDCSSNDRLNLTVREADSTTYPNIRQYIQEKIINGRVQICTTMIDALSHFVNVVCNSDPVEESLNGIREVLGNVQSSQIHKDVKLNAGNKL
ncbi:unnamed protein product, partial [Rotaria sp. Silwood1]